MDRMINFKKAPIIVLIALVLSLGVFHFNYVSAQTTVLTDSQVESVRASCTPAKNILSQLHASDALLRVNRGQIYESMSTKLMARFNNRVSGSGFNTQYLSQAMQDYTASLNDFRASYRVYEERLSSTINIDCSKNPIEFYQSLMDSRYNRTVLHTSVVKLNQKMDDYGSAVIDFRDSFFGETGTSL